MCPKELLCASFSGSDLFTLLPLLLYFVVFRNTEWNSLSLLLAMSHDILTSWHPYYEKFHLKKNHPTQEWVEHISVSIVVLNVQHPGALREYLEVAFLDLTVTDGSSWEWLFLRRENFYLLWGVIKRRRCVAGSKGGIFFLKKFCLQ